MRTLQVSTSVDTEGIFDDGLRLVVEELVSAGEEQRGCRQYVYLLRAGGGAKGRGSRCRGCVVWSRKPARYCLQVFICACSSHGDKRGEVWQAMDHTKQGRES